MPILAANGVRAIHMGYNNGGHFPTAGLPTNTHLTAARTFRWQHSAAGVLSEVIVMNEPSYGPSSRPKRVLVLAARTLNATGQPGVPLSLR